MRRREVIAALAAVVWPQRARAQQRRRVVLFVTPFRILPSATLDILRQSMADFGRVESQDVAVEAIFDPQEVPGALSKQKVDVIFASGPESVRAAAQTTRTIPIVAFDLETDPVQAGYIASFARPGGNITGLFLDQPELAGKWIQLIQQVAPQVKRVAAVWDPGTGESQRKAIDAAAAQLGLQLFVVEMRLDLEAVVAEARTSGAQALVFGSPHGVAHSYSRNSNVTWWTQGRRRPKTRIRPRQDRRRCPQGGDGERHDAFGLHAGRLARREEHRSRADGCRQGCSAIRPCPSGSH